MAISMVLASRAQDGKSNMAVLTRLLPDRPI